MLKIKKSVMDTAGSGSGSGRGERRESSDTDTDTDTDTLLIFTQNVVTGESITFPLSSSNCS